MGISLPPTGAKPIEKHRPRGVRPIGGVHFSVRQFPHKIRIHRTKQQFAFFRPHPLRICFIQNPFDFRRGKIRVGNQPRFFAYAFPCARFYDLFDPLRRASALPYDGVIHGLTRRLFPHDRGFALIRDADRSDVLHGNPAFRDRLHHYSVLAGPYIHRIVLHPALSRVDLRKFSV